MTLGNIIGFILFGYLACYFYKKNIMWAAVLLGIFAIGNLITIGDKAECDKL